MERGIEIFVCINVLIIGFSHFFYPGAWVQFFKVLAEKGQAGSLANGFISITFGSLIVAFHWVWEGIIPISVTLLGIAQVIKSFVAFVLPSVGMRSISHPRASREASYKIGGVVFLVYGLLLSWYLYTTR